MIYSKWIIEEYSDENKENDIPLWARDNRERCSCGGTIELIRTDVFEQYGMVVENYRCDSCGYSFPRTVSREMR